MRGGSSRNGHPSSLTVQEAAHRLRCFCCARELAGSGSCLPSARLAPYAGALRRVCSARDIAALQLGTTIASARLVRLLPTAGGGAEIKHCLRFAEGALLLRPSPSGRLSRHHPAGAGAGSGAPPAGRRGHRHTKGKTGWNLLTASY